MIRCRIVIIWCRLGGLHNDICFGRNPRPVLTLEFLNHKVICVSSCYYINDTLTVYCVKPCMILTNTRTARLCKVRFGSNDYSNCSIV